LISKADQTNGDRMSWDEYWIEIAQVVKIRSTDPKTKVGAVIVKENVLISTGYNGFARDVQHHECRTIKETDNPEKLRWMCHAEQDAIYNAARVGVSVAGAKIYTTKFPCLICTNAIVQAGIIGIYTVDTKPYDDNLTKDDGRRVYQILSETNVRLEAPNLKTSILIDPMSSEDGHPDNEGD